MLISISPMAVQAMDETSIVEVKESESQVVPLIGIASDSATADTNPNIVNDVDASAIEMDKLSVPVAAGAAESELAAAGMDREGANDVPVVEAEKRTRGNG